MNKFYSLLSISIIFILFAFSCKPKTKQSEDTIIDTTKKDVKIENINFFLETSASMAGYLNSKSELKDILAPLLVSFESSKFDIKKLNLCTVSDTITFYDTIAKTFIEMVATDKNIANNKSSEFHKIFEKIAGYTNENDISIFVSDCLFSFSPEEVRKNNNINLENITTLRSNIQSVFQDLNSRNFGVSIFGFYSNFDGQYFTYQNNKRYIKNEKRPFYVWIIAKSDVLQLFEDKLKENKSLFPYVEELHFGSNNQITDCMIMFSMFKGAKFRTKEPYNSITEVNETPFEFLIALNLTSLDSLCKDTSYLMNNLIIKTSNSIKAEIISVTNSSGECKNAEEKNRAVNYTHFVKIKVNEMISKCDSIQISMESKLPEWYKDWSTMDDSKKENNLNKTWGFSEFVGGVITAYQLTEKDNNCINVNIKMIK